MVAISLKDKLVAKKKHQVRTLKARIEVGASTLTLSGIVSNMERKSAVEQILKHIHPRSIASAPGARPKSQGADAEGG